MNLEQHISNLLFSHDCVIVPDFGAFITQKNTATIADNQILPPTKRVGFNISLDKSDGLLIQTVARLENLSYHEAQSKVSDQVNSWKSNLAKQGELELSELGKFEIGDEGKMIFNPVDKNYLVESFGLESLRLVHVMNQTTETTTSNKAVWWKVASIIPIVLGGYLYFAKPQPVADYVNQQWSGFVMPLLNSDTKINLNSTSIHKEIQKKDKIETDLNENIKEAEIIEAVEIKSHQVIAGSFRLLSEAESFEQKLKEKGFSNAMFTQKKGRYFYVAYDTFETREEANEYRRSIQSEHPDAWVLSIEE